MLSISIRSFEKLELPCLTVGFHLGQIKCRLTILCCKTSHLETQQHVIVSLYSHAYIGYSSSEVSSLSACGLALLQMSHRFLLGITDLQECSSLSMAGAPELNQKHARRLETEAQNQSAVTSASFFWTKTSHMAKARIKRKGSSPLSC